MTIDLEEKDHVKGKDGEKEIVDLKDDQIKKEGVEEKVEEEKDKIKESNLIEDKKIEEDVNTQDNNNNNNNVENPLIIIEEDIEIVKVNEQNDKIKLLVKLFVFVGEKVDPKMGPKLYIEFGADFKSQYVIFPFSCIRSVELTTKVKDKKSNLTLNYSQQNSKPFFTSASRKQDSVDFTPDRFISSSTQVQFLLRQRKLKKLLSYFALYRIEGANKCLDQIKLNLTSEEQQKVKKQEESKGLISNLVNYGTNVFKKIVGLEIVDPSTPHSLGQVVEKALQDNMTVSTSNQELFEKLIMNYQVLDEEFDRLSDPQLHDKISQCSHPIHFLLLINLEKHYKFVNRVKIYENIILNIKGNILKNNFITKRVFPIYFDFFKSNLNQDNMSSIVNYLGILQGLSFENEGTFTEWLNYAKRTNTLHSPDCYQYVKGRRGNSDVIKLFVKYLDLSSPTNSSLDSFELISQLVPSSLSNDQINFLTQSLHESTIERLLSIYRTFPKFGRRVLQILINKDVDTFIELIKEMSPNNLDDLGYDSTVPFFNSLLANGLSNFSKLFEIQPFIKGVLRGRFPYDFFVQMYNADHLLDLYGSREESMKPFQFKLIPNLGVNALTLITLHYPTFDFKIDINYNFRNNVSIEKSSKLEMIYQEQNEIVMDNKMFERYSILVQSLCPLFPGDHHTIIKSSPLPLPCSYAYLQISNRLIGEDFKNNYRNILNHPNFEKLLSIQIPQEYKHWPDEVKYYKTNLVTVKFKLEEIISSFKVNFKKGEDNVYTPCARILNKVFGSSYNDNIQDFFIEHDNLIKEQRLIQLSIKSLKEYFGFDINTPLCDSKTANYGAVKANLNELLELSFKSKGRFSRTVEQKETLISLGEFDNNGLFKVILSSMSKDLVSDKSIDSIVKQTSIFSASLINKDPQMKIGHVLEYVWDYKSKTSKSQLEYDLESMYNKFRISKTSNFQLDVKSIHEFIENATSVFSMRNNIQYLYKFFGENTYIKVKDLDKWQTKVNDLLEKIGSLKTVEEIKPICLKMSQMLGNLNQYQLALFGGVHPDVIEFYSSLGDRKRFDQRNQLITTNLFANTYSAGLHNKAVQAYEHLDPFVQLKVNSISFNGITEFCKFIGDQISDKQSILESVTIIIIDVKDNLDKIKAIYSSKGGTYSSESILPTVIEILNGSIFKSRTSKWESNEAGMLIEVPHNTFSKENIEDFDQGLKFFATQQMDDDKKEKIKQFDQLVQTLKIIHWRHCELARVCHPMYFEGQIEKKIGDKQLVALQAYCRELEKDYNDWQVSIRKLPPILLTLRAHGLSSLISKYHCAGPTPASLVESIFPYIIGCYPALTKPILLALLKKKHHLLSNKIGSEKFFNDLHAALNDEGVETLFQYMGGRNHHNGCILVQMATTKPDLFKDMMQLNDSIMPHPFQLFFAETFANDFEFFKWIVESLPNSRVFLVGVPKDMVSLVQWLSDHASNQTIDKLGRVYIMSLDQNDGSEHLNFLPTYNDKFEPNWNQFKDTWRQIKDNGIEGLELVYGPSGVGKTYYIRSKSTEYQYSLTIHLRPGFSTSALIEKLQTISEGSPSTEKIKVFLHIIVSPYSNPVKVDQFIYPMISYGFIYGQRVGDIINIGDRFQINVTLEIGEPATEKKIEFKNFSDYLANTFPLLYRLSNIWNQGGCKWVIGKNETTCIKEMGITGQDPIITMRQTLVKVAKTYDISYDPNYLLDGQYLSQTKNVIDLLGERLNFLAHYRGYHGYLVSQGYGSRVVSPQQLLSIFIVESVKLSDPSFSAQQIWHNPPILTSFSLVQDELGTVDVGYRNSPLTKAHIEYLDFSRFGHQSLQNIDSKICLEVATLKPLQFRTTVSNAFGIHYRTWMISNLCQQYSFVLTPEFAVRLLILHSKVKNQRSLVLTGDTGVGKTHILLFYSSLINAMNDAMPDILYSLATRINTFIETYKKQVGKLDPNNLNVDAIIKTAEDIVRPSKEKRNIFNIINDADRKQEDLERINFFGIIESEIKGLLKKYPLISKPGDGTIMNKIVHDKGSMASINNCETLVAAITQLSNTRFKSLFKRRVMHLKFTSQMFIELVHDAISDAKELEKIDASLKMVVFIDEFNTAPPDTLALINEVFVDGTLDGHNIIPSNVFWVGAMNPKKISTNRSNQQRITTAVDYTGQMTVTSHVDFVVSDAPPSMKHLLMNYGEFGSEQEPSFLDSLFALKPNISDQPGSLKSFIIISQTQLRQLDETRVHVSIRDIIRAIDIYMFFRQNPVGKSILDGAKSKKQQYPKDHDHWASMIVSIALTYTLRVPPGTKRNFMIQQFDRYLEQQKSPILGFTSFFKRVYSRFCRPKNTSLPKGIALTEALQLNLFCTVVSINCKIPLCIVGPPGCSKTLSFTIVVDNMNRSNKHLSDTSPWSKMNNVQTFRSQCTQHTTDTEIEQRFRQAIDRQTSQQSDSKSKTQCVLFFDEAGLVNETESPMKVMHDYLDKVSQKFDNSKNDVEIATVILSNKVLDAAKTNRMMVLIHNENITKEDEIALVKGCLFNNQTLDKEQEEICKSLCKSYKKANKFTKATKPDLYHQRDFVYFLRHLARSLCSMGSWSPSMLLNSLERNFGGIPLVDFRELAKNFFNGMSLVKGFNSFNSTESIKLIDDHDNTITRIKESLEEKFSVEEDPNTCVFRYTMLIDPTNNETALSILEELQVKHQVIRVGGFEKDGNSESLVKVVTQIKNAMSIGETVVLVNTQLVDACFYDVFNRYFSINPTEKGKEFVANVSFGTHSTPCAVHPQFRIIVHVPVSRLQYTQLPWLNRFEKYYLSLDNMIQYFLDSRKENKTKLTEFTKQLFSNSNHFINEFHTKNKNTLFSGFTSDTVSSLVYSTIKEIDGQGDQYYTLPYRPNNNQPIELDPSSIMSPIKSRYFNFKLLQIARPESLFNCKSLGNMYMKEYLNNQEHFNVLRFLQKVFQHRCQPIDKSKIINNITNKIVICTRTSQTLTQSLKDSANVEKLKSMLTDRVERLKIIQLSLIKTSSDCELEIKLFKSSLQNFCMVVADMSTINQHQINFVVGMFRDLPSSKLAVILCHYPPESSISNNVRVNSIFLNGLEHYYIDSLGIRIDRSLLEHTPMQEVETDYRSLIAKSFGLDDVIIDPSKIGGIFKSMLFDHLQDAASTMIGDTNSWNIKRLPPKDQQFYKDAKHRRKVILELFNQHPQWHNPIISAFIAKWDKEDLFKEIISNISNLIVTGRLVSPFIDAIRSSIVSFLYPVVSQILKTLVDYLSYGVVSRAQPGSKDETLITLYIQSIKIPNLSTNIEERFQPVQLTMTGEGFRPSSLPLYDSMFQTLSTILEHVLSKNKDRNQVDVVQRFEKDVLLHPIGKLVQFVDENDELATRFKTDFVSGSLKFGRDWTDFIINVLDIIAPINSYSILKYIALNKFHSNLLVFLMSMVQPMVNLIGFEQISIETFSSQFQKIEKGQKLMKSDVIKGIVANCSIKMLNERIQSIGHDMESITNWCTVVKEILNRVHIEELLVLDKLSSKIHILYQLLIYITSTHPDEMVAKMSQVVLNMIESKQQNPVTFLDKLNGKLKETNLPLIGLSCTLDVIQPLFEKQDYEPVIQMVCGAPSYPLQIIISIPSSWYSHMLLLALNRNEDIVKSTFNNWYQGNPSLVMNPVLAPMYGNPENKGLIKFLQGQPPPSDLPTLSLYHALLEHYKTRKEKGNRKQIYSALSKCNDFYSRIEWFVQSTMYINQLAMVLNDQSMKPNQKIGRIGVDKDIYQSILRDRIYHAYLFNIINRDDDLGSLFKSKDILELLGLQPYFVDETLSIRNLSQLPFVVDNTSQLGRDYQRILNSIENIDLKEFDQIVQQSAGNQKALGFIRMSLFLISYSMYLGNKNQQINFINSIINNARLLDLGPFVAQFRKVLRGEYATNGVFDPILRHGQEKSMENRSIAQMLVNFAAISIGSSNNNYLYHLIRSPANVAAKSYIANEGALKDCGMTYRMDQRAAPPSTSSMSGNILYKFMVTSTTWGALSWAALNPTHAPVLGYVASTRERDTSLIDFFTLRAVTSIREVSMHTQINQQHIDTGHFLSELAFSVWDESYSAPRPEMRSVFTGLEIQPYETYLVGKIEGLLKVYQNLKQARIKSDSKAKSNIFKDVQQIRVEYSKINNSPFMDFESIHHLVAQDKNHLLLLFFTTNLNKICISSDIPILMNFLHLLFTHFNRRLPIDYISKTIPDCIKYLESQGEREETITSLRNEWGRLKESWKNIREQLNIMEGGCRERPTYEKVIQTLADDTPLQSIIFTKDNGDGMIISLVTNWLDNTQAQSIEFRDKVDKQTYYSDIITPLTKLSDKELASIPFDYGENYLLVGSNFKTSQFSQFLSHAMSHYHSFYRSRFVPNLHEIEIKLITKYLTGKAANYSLSPYKIDFPFVYSQIELAKYSQQNSIVSSQDHLKLNLQSQSIQDLITLEKLLDEKLYGQSFTIEKSFSTLVKSKLVSQEAENLCRFITSVIIHHRNGNKKLKETDTKISIYDWSKQRGIHQDLSDGIIKVLKSTTLGNIKTIAKIVIEGYIGCGYLYSGTIIEPNHPDARIIGDLQKIKSAIINDTSRIDQWNDYLKKVLQLFTTEGCIKTIKSRNIGDDMASFLGPFIKDQQSPIIQTLQPFTYQLFPPRITINYYPILMRMIHEILSTFYINSQSIVKQLYIEPFKVDSDIKDKQEQEEEEEDDLDEMVGEMRNWDLQHDDKQQCRPIQPHGDHQFIHLLLNWIRFKNIISPSTTTPLGQLLQECDQHLDSPVNIDLFVQSLKSKVAPQILLSPSQLLIDMLKVFSNKVNNDQVFSYVTTLLCPNCNSPIQYDQQESNFDYHSMKDIKIDDILNQKIHDIIESNLSKDCLKCKTQVKPTLTLKNTPTYLFFNISRLNVFDENYKEFDVTIDNNNLQIILGTSTKNYYYELDSIMYSNNGELAMNYKIDDQIKINVHGQIITKMNSNNKDIFKDKSMMLIFKYNHQRTK